MTAVKMHANEVHTDAQLVGRLLAAQFPQWAGLPLTPVPSAGTDNALYRLSSDMVVRLPRIDWAAGQAEKECQWLPRLAPHLPLAIPEQLARKIGIRCQKLPCLFDSRQTMVSGMYPTRLFLHRAIRPFCLWIVTVTVVSCATASFMITYRRRCGRRVCQASNPSLSMVMAGFRFKSCLFYTAVGAFERNYRAILLRDGTDPPGSNEFADTVDASLPGGGWVRTILTRFLEDHLGYSSTCAELIAACRSVS
jgi:hypothetical protein